MTPAAAAILEGMPDPSLLHRADRDGTTWIMAGSVVLSDYPSGDVVMRNIAVAVLRQLGFRGRAVAAVLGLSENYVATLHNRALREGTAGLVRAPGRPRKVAAAPGSRRPGGGPGVPPTARSAGGWGSRSPRCSAAWARPPCRSSCLRAGPQAGRSRRRAGQRPGPRHPGRASPRHPGRRQAEPAAPEPSARPAAEPGSAAGTEAAPGRYAGAMLPHAYLDRIGAEAILAAARRRAWPGPATTTWRCWPPRHWRSRSGPPRPSRSST